MHVFSIAQMAHIVTYLFHRVNRVIDRMRQITLDMDSTVHTVYGTQEGARVEYNSHKPEVRLLSPSLLHSGMRLLRRAPSSLDPVEKSSFPTMCS